MKQVWRDANTLHVDETLLQKLIQLLEELLEVAAQRLVVVATLAQPDGGHVGQSRETDPDRAVLVFAITRLHGSVEAELQ